MMEELQRLYRAAEGELGAAARDTLGAMRRIESLGSDRDYQPAGGADYGGDRFSRGLVQVARLVKADVGLEAASVDLDGWDSHFAQSTVMDPRMTELAQGLRAFDRDMGQRMESTTVVVMSEFGRRVKENSAFGTDHGRGGVMFVMGGGVRGGRVLSDWKGMAEDQLVDPGDLPVVYNYRNVLAPLLRRHGGGDDFSRIFPDFDLQPIDLYT
jgi:uncharacterized protein (DUF1501 family)